MGVQYVIVRYHETRGVLVDDQACGVTGKPIMVDEGTHSFSLEGDADCDPPRQVALVSGHGSPLRPYEIEFS